MEGKQLTPLQVSVMRSLWSRGEARVAEVQADLASNQRLALTTVATLLRRLTARGLVAFRKEGRQFVYRPLVSEEEASKSMVAELNERLFEGDVLKLMTHLIEEHEVRAGDLERVRALIDAHERSAGRKEGE
jgi:predicted transcriptional regulator